jgi:hypothetical protein
MLHHNFPLTRFSRLNLSGRINDANKEGIQQINGKSAPNWLKYNAPARNSNG